MNKWMTGALGAVLAVTLLAGCGTTGKDQAAAKEEKKLKVVASFDAMAEFAKAVGKDKIDVVTLIPAGTEPHGFEPSTEVMKEMTKADVFIYNGLGMEPWQEKATAAAKNDKLVKVEAAKDVDAIKNTDPEEVEEHGEFDPHTWLSPACAEKEINTIAAALAQADPDNKDYYMNNAKEYTAQLKQLQSDYAEKFKNVHRRDFVTGHAAFAYLCRDFDLMQKSVEDVFAEGEPSPKKLAELTEYCRENKITTIFAEEMVSPAVSRALANEVGAKVEIIDTMESNKDGATYMDRMKDNLEKIYASMM